MKHEARSLGGPAPVGRQDGAGVEPTGRGKRTGRQEEVRAKKKKKWNDVCAAPTIYPAPWGLPSTHQPHEPSPQGGIRGGRGWLPGGKAEGQARLPRVWRTGRPEDVGLCLHSHGGGEVRGEARQPCRKDTEGPDASIYAS